MKNSEQTTAGIVGLGVMGGSFAARFKQMGFRVIGFDTSTETLDYAFEHGMIDEGSTDPKELLKKCNLVVFCLYPRKIAAWIRKYHDDFAPGSLLMEISGVKSSVIDEIEQSAAPDLHLISVHPMCGRESQGIRFSSPDIFSGSNFIIIDHNSTSEKMIEEARELAQAMGFGKISVLSAKEHDRMIAFLSQLTHVIAVCLMNTHENAHLTEYTGDSFRDLTRIAKINENMWPELFLLNKDVLLDEIDSFENALSGFRKALEDDDRDEMARLMVQSTKRRQRFDR